MSPRIQLDESVSEAPIVARVRGKIPPSVTRPLLEADWEDYETEP
jgi:hypothetical protein